MRGSVQGMTELPGRDVTELHELLVTAEAQTGAACMYAAAGSVMHPQKA